MTLTKTNPFLLTTTAATAMLVALIATGPATAATAAPSGPDSRMSADRVDGSPRLVQDAHNETGIPGISSTVDMAAGDRLVSAADGQQVSLVDASGAVLFTVSAPTLGTGATGQNEIAAELTTVGNHIVITPVGGTAASTFSACASSFWGNLIFNIGMAGVCAGLAVGTVVGGVVCTAALIGANTQINFDSQC